MPADYLPHADTAFQKWLNNFETIAAANLTTLGLTPADISNLTGAQTTFNTDMALLETSKAATVSATTNKTVARKVADSEVRLLVRKIQSNPGVPVSLKNLLKINAHNTPKTNTPPTSPVGLMAAPDVNGVNSLKWKRSDNKPTTSFIIEAMVGTADTFTQIGVTMKTKFSHKGQTVGVKVIYRVTAERADMTSIPSLPVSVYDAPAPVTLQKAA